MIETTVTLRAGGEREIAVAIGDAGDEIGFAVGALRRASQRRERESRERTHPARKEPVKCPRPVIHDVDDDPSTVASLQLQRHRRRADQRKRHDDEVGRRVRVF